MNYTANECEQKDHVTWKFLRTSSEIETLTSRLVVQCLNQLFLYRSLTVLYPYLFLCRDCPAFCVLSLFKAHNTNIHTAGGIRTRNPSRRSDADPRFRPLGHWNRQPSTPPLAPTIVIKTTKYHDHHNHRKYNNHHRHRYQHNHAIIANCSDIPPVSVPPISITPPAPLHHQHHHHHHHIIIVITAYSYSTGRSARSIEVYFLCTVLR